MLYFRDSKGNRRLITKCEEHEVFAYIKEFLDERNYKYYYVRTWGKDNEIWYDVGSHTEFFVYVKED